MPKDKGGNPNLIAKSPNPSQASSGYHNIEDLGISKDFNRSQASTGLQNLKDLGITYNQSSQCQKIANMPETV